MSVNEVKIQPAPFDLDVRGTGHPSSRTYAIGDEDHTLGNALRHVLMQNQKVEFAGYSVPHPSEPVVHIRVQTAKNSNRDNSGVGLDDGEDGEDSSKLPAIDVLKEACATLVGQCDIVLDKLEELLPEVRQDRIDLEIFLRNDGCEEGEEDMGEGEVVGDVEEEVYEDEDMM